LGQEWFGVAAQEKEGVNGSCRRAPWTTLCTMCVPYRAPVARALPRLRAAAAQSRATALTGRARVQAILRWSISQTDTSAGPPSEAKPMDPEKRAFLEKVMSEMVENEGKSMKDLVEVGTPAPAPCSRARLAREAGAVPGTCARPSPASLSARSPVSGPDPRACARTGDQGPRGHARPGQRQAGGPGGCH